MLGKSAKVELPRRVVVYYLLYLLMATLWLTVIALFTAKSILVRSQEAELLSYLNHAATVAKVELAHHDAPPLQPLLERFSREQSLRSCAFVADDNTYVAHSEPGFVGQSRRVVAGLATLHEQIESVQYLSGSLRVREYSVPIVTDEGSAWTLIVTQAEPTMLETLRLAGRHTLVMLGGPLLLVALGGFKLHRIVHPMAVVESQLRQAAIASTLANLELAPINSAGPIVLGWNRIVRALQEANLQCGLEQRVSGAVQSLRQGKSDDVLHSLIDGVAVSNQEGKVTFANLAIAAIFAPNSEPDSLCGTDIESFLGFDAEEASVASLFDPDLFARQVVEEVERGDGDAKQFFRIARQPIRVAQNASSVGHVWTVRDVSQQKLADAMRDQFLDNATHELRTPLANIKAYAETLTMSDSIDVESQKEFCNTINAEATRLARFIDDLLSVSSMEAGSLTLNKQGVDLERLFSEVVGKVKPQMDQKRLEFETIFPAKYPQTKLDKDKVNVALVNLLGNAAKYTPDGGRVRFEVKITDREIRIEVEDTGVGIAEEELPRIYDKFFRSSNPFVQEINGTGLGLSLANEVVKLHGGDLTVQSTVGLGTTFVATLPLE